MGIRSEIGKLDEYGVLGTMEEYRYGLPPSIVCEMTGLPPTYLALRGVPFIYVAIRHASARRSSRGKPKARGVEVGVPGFRKVYVR